MPQGAAIRTMFAGIARRYDLTNRILSFGMEGVWRRKLVRLAVDRRPGDIADLATGSGVVAYELKKALPAARVRGYDFCRPMLDVAEAKQASQPAAEKIPFALGDCLALPLADSSLDALTIAYGVRNFEDRPKGLREMRRVLRPGGSAYIMEFTQPSWWMRPFYYIYLKTLLPLVAWAATGDRKAYEYLGGSIASFPSKEKIAEELIEAGFSKVRAIGLTGSIIAIHVAEA
jgi:demethylmenaquinone methyltransferase / 2-methoxy-6-polyprenyl-1,4-benzoquinol methylase